VHGSQVFVGALPSRRPTAKYISPQLTESTCASCPSSCHAWCRRRRRCFCCQQPRCHLRHARCSLHRVHRHCDLRTNIRCELGACCAGHSTTWSPGPVRSPMSDVKHPPSWSRKKQRSSRRWSQGSAQTSSSKQSCSSSQTAQYRLGGRAEYLARYRSRPCVHDVQDAFSAQRSHME
jgi:hypothetical protein